MAEQTQTNMIHVRLRELGKPLCFSMNADIEFCKGDLVIVEQDKGLDYGMIISDCHHDQSGQSPEEIHRVVRLATPEDRAQIRKNKKKISDVFNVCVRKVQESGLKMKLIQGEYSFDRTKIILYFSADGRIDFRELVKDLAHIFRVRIELKQIGVRDEAKLIGGCGPCGRQMCCVSYLKDFKPVTIRMAKDQNLSLNPSKISGVCGRLMCCLEYEHGFYRFQCKGLPRVGDTIKFQGKKAKVMGVNAFHRSATVLTEDNKFEVVQYPKSQNEKECCNNNKK